MKLFVLNIILVSVNVAASGVHEPKHPEKMDMKEFVEYKNEQEKAKHSQQQSGQEDIFSPGNGGLRHRHHRVLYTQCLSEFSFRTTRGCTEAGFDEFEAALQAKLQEEGCGHWASKEVELVTGKISAWMWFYESCMPFWNQREKVSIDHLFEGSDIHLKAYFDGGSHFNDLKQTQLTDSGDTKYRLSTMAQPIDDFEAGPMSHDVVRMPQDGSGDYVSNFKWCHDYTAYCCFVQDIQANDGNGNCAEPYDFGGCDQADPADNVDICYADMSRAPASPQIPEGFAFYPDDSEGDAHCHGLAWSWSPLDVTNIFRGNTLSYISLADHLRDRGYAKNVAGSPMCACSEQMAVVDRADCSEPVLTQSTVFGWNQSRGPFVDIDDNFSVEFQACQAATNNDLASFVDKLVSEYRLGAEQQAKFEESIVGDCEVPIQNFLSQKKSEYGL